LNTLERQIAGTKADPSLYFPYIFSSRFSSLFAACAFREEIIRSIKIRLNILGYHLEAVRQYNFRNQASKTSICAQGRLTIHAKHPLAWPEIRRLNVGKAMMTMRRAVL
jgi:hypothetical protein